MQDDVNFDRREQKIREEWKAATARNKVLDEAIDALRAMKTEELTWNQAYDAGVLKYPISGEIIVPRS